MPSVPRFQRALLARHFQQGRIELHKRHLHRRVFRMAFDTGRNGLTGKRLGRIFPPGPKLKNAHPSGNRESFTSASRKARLVWNRPALLIDASLDDARNSRTKTVLSGHLPGLHEAAIRGWIHENVRERLRRRCRDPPAGRMSCQGRPQKRPLAIVDRTDQVRPAHVAWTIAGAGCARTTNANARHQTAPRTTTILFIARSPFGTG